LSRKEESAEEKTVQKKSAEDQEKFEKANSLLKDLLGNSNPKDGE